MIAFLLTSGSRGSDRLTKATLGHAVGGPGTYTKASDPSPVSLFADVQVLHPRRKSKRWWTRSPRSPHAVAVSPCVGASETGCTATAETRQPLVQRRTADRAGKALCSVE